MISYFNLLTNRCNIFICVVVEYQRLWFSWMLVYTSRIPMGMSMIPTLALYLHKFLNGITLISLASHGSLLPYAGSPYQLGFSTLRT